MLDLEELYRGHHPEVYRFALYLSGSRAEAEDIAAETFLRVWNARDNVRLATVKAYLFAIARHLYRDGLRRRSREAELGDELVDPSPDPAETAAGRRELAGVLEALGRLPEVDRAALLLRAGHGMSYDEIAGVLGIGVSAARVKVHRARIRLAAIHARGGRERT